MNNIYSLEKLLDIKENEMNDVHSQYNRSIEHFEQVGQQLYEVLTYKEKIEHELEKAVNQRVKAITFSRYNQQLENLKVREQELQMQVHQARLNMQNKEEELKLAHQEVKKLEKLIERRTSEQNILNRKLENRFLDEISVQQYVRVNG